MRLNHPPTVATLLFVNLFAIGGALAKEPAAQSLFDGKELGNWQVADFEGAGEPHVEEGRLILPFGERLTGVKWNGPELPRMNYEINLDAQRTDGSDFFCGLTFPYSQTYASLIVGGWGGSLCGISSINGDDAAHNDTRTFQHLENNHWYHIRLRVTASKLQAWIDKEKIVDVVTTGKQIDIRRDIDQSKPLGIASFQCSAALKNITLTPIELVSGDQKVRTEVWPKPVVDARAEMIRTLYQGSGFKPYTDKGAWQQRAAEVRQQVLISAGLWPMPEKTPLNAVIHGKVDRGDYTVEKVYFQSYPGFFVSGSLYRPKGKTGPFPGILSPHGHWKDGRFNETPEKEIANQIKGGWEKDEVAAKYILQARCANLAKLGCVVFHYDMVGYADSDAKNFPHRETYRDTDSDQHLLSVFGLQTWDSIRSLDFLESLPEVDRSRLACTGASGGATQTFMLMAVDDRLAAAAPVCMISAGDHQGGCVCENNSLLRLGTDNVEIAATFAPRPFIHPTATGDWTREFMEKGYPEIRATYGLFGVPDAITAFRQTSGHNYNSVSREAVYTFFNDVFKLGHASPVKEEKFEAIAPKDLSVWDEEHPRPKEALDQRRFKDSFVAMTDKQIAALLPKDAGGLARARAVMEPALRHMLFTRLPAGGEVTIETLGEQKLNGVRIQKITLQRKDDAQALAALWLNVDSGKSGKPLVVVAPEGKACIADDTGALASWVKPLVESGRPLLVVDVYDTGELTGKAKPPAKPVEFFAGYNRTRVANRVHDVLTAIAAAKVLGKSETVDLAGVRGGGPWALLARCLAGNSVAKTVADGDEFDFDHVRAPSDENYLPGSMRYGGMWPLVASLVTPGELTVGHFKDEKTPDWLTAAYRAAGEENKLHVVEKVTEEAFVKLLGN